METGLGKEPADLVLEPLRIIRGDIARLDRKIDVKIDGLRTELRSETADLRSDFHSLRADVAADFVTMRKETGEQIAGLRRAVVEHHSAVLGHGVLIWASKRACVGWSSISACRQ